MKGASKALRLFLRLAVSALMVAVITRLAFALHAKSFIAEFLYLLLILPIALEWGFAEGTAASVMAMVSLDFFFTQPLFSLNMSDPQDWVALGAFEAVVLTVSHLAGRLRSQTTEMAVQQAHVDRLYTMSRELLLVNGGEAAGKHLTSLIMEVFGASGVALWSRREEKLYCGGNECTSEDQLRHASEHDSRQDDQLRGKFTRVLSRRALDAAEGIDGPRSAAMTLLAIALLQEGNR
jgi:two-component system sensor histidine kinase KdpD